MTKDNPMQLLADQINTTIVHTLKLCEKGINKIRYSKDVLDNEIQIDW